MRRVTILQHRLMHYRTALFEQLRAQLAERDIELRLVHGQASPAEQVKKDEGHIEWADRVVNRYLTVGGRDLMWQPLPGELSDSDLLIVMQENRILSNYPLLLKGRLGRQRVAYWGHGRNFQSHAPGGLRERWKNAWLRQVAWWFAYTEVTVEHVVRSGFPAERITCLDNAIDTSSFRRDLAAVTERDLTRLRAELGLTADAPVGLYCGSLYPEKRLDLMVAASRIVRRHIPDFALVVVGDGPSAAGLRESLASDAWAHCVGAKRGVEKAAYFKLARITLNPGLVGLHVLDAFCAGLPMVTTRNALHSPEIAYLDDGKNGFITGDDPEEYAAALLRLLREPALHADMVAAGMRASDRYTLDHMVANFVGGIETCLNERN